MIDSKKLLEDLQRQVTTLEDDLRARCDAEPAVDAPLKMRWDEARERARTALTYKAWREEELTNVAVAWILACVFVRFLEDNGLVDTCYLAGPDAPGLGRARDQHELFFREHSLSTERDYLEHVFTATAALPAMAEFFDRRHNPLWSVGPTGDAAAAMLNFWRRADPVTGRPLHDFSDPEWSTRFLGDLYQDLSAAARKRYALLQTPVFVEQFILDRTLTPAIETFGFKEVRMIDPTCGSGHFCLGGFARLHKLWVESEPAESPSVLAQRALDQVFGVDLNPNVVAIARFRLLLAALRVTGTTQLRHAFNFRINVATGDSLLHGRRFRAYEMNFGVQNTFDTEEVFRDELKHHYEVEDVEALHRILGQQYHAVVGNPPYITVKDRAVSELYRARFPSCSGKYALSVPFMERFFDLAVKGDGTPQQPAGFVGQITSNSFMKREFGKKLIEEYLPRWDLTHVLDTAGAYIPGHGTPTVILFGKNQPFVSGTIRTVLGIAGEPATPTDPALGLVWQAIVRQINNPGSVSEWVSAADSPRASFHRHPWSIGGGGAAELKETIENAADCILESLVASIGIGAVTLEDEAFVAPKGVHARAAISDTLLLDFAEGDILRDWAVENPACAVFPYERPGLRPASNSRLLQFLWPNRTTLRNRKWFRKTQDERGLFWWEYGFASVEKVSSLQSMAWPEVATHNHFVLDTKGRVFKNSAPVIKLKHDAVECGYSRLLGVLNSSSACFYLKQICHNKGSTVDAHGARQRTAAFEDFYAFNGTQIASFPFPTYQPSQLPTALVKTSTALQGQSPAATLASWGGPESGDLRPWLASARDLATRQRRQLIAWQEELDWQIYEAFGLVEGAAESGPAAVSLPEGAAVDAIPPEGIELGQRAFEIVLARRMAAGEAQSTWFERHGSTPITEVPRHWPAPYRELVERRLRRIADDPAIRLIEQPEYKRRWNTGSWDKQQETALRHWLLNRLELYFHEADRLQDGEDETGKVRVLVAIAPLRAKFAGGGEPRLVSVRQLAQTAQADSQWMEAATVFAGRADFDVAKLVETLVLAESVPALPAQRYKPAGLRNRVEWEKTWELQRAEDAVEAEVRSSAAAKAMADKQGAGVGEEELKKLVRKEQLARVGEIPVPPKYGSGDFLKSSYWKLRGKLDVPKERWVVYPGMEGGHDASPVIAWAGWDHAQQAAALTSFYQQAKDTWGWQPERLAPLLAALKELLPWLHQWHNAIDPEYGDRISTTYQQFYETECHTLRMTDEDIEWLRMSE